MKRFRIFAACAIALTVAMTAYAGDLRSTRSPESVGISEERLDRIDRAMEGQIDAGRMIGGVGMIVRDGKVAYSNAWGQADREADQAMTEDHIFRIYSMSKPITSVAIMMLYEEGKFNLNDPVSRHIPELGGLKVLIEKVPPKPREESWLEDDSETLEIDPEHYELVDSERDMTVRDLLRHTSGLTYGFFGNRIVDQMYRKAGILRDQATLEEFVTELGKLPLLHQPGTTYQYSVSTDVLGRLVEVLSGMPYDQYLETRIFGPLDMIDTGFQVPASEQHRLAQMYTPNSETRAFEVSDDQLNQNFKPGATFFSGGGGMVSTAHDYARFCQMLLNDGRLDDVQILSRKTIELMTADHLGEMGEGMQRGGYTFGLGFAVAQDIGRMAAPGSIGEFNWGGAAGTKFWIDPNEDMVGVFMIQVIPPPFNYGQQFKNLAYMSIVD